MWRELKKIIGRDKLLKKLLQLLRKNKSFLLSSSEGGLGKTTILEFCFENYQGKKAFICGGMSVKEIYLTISNSKGWDLKAVDDGDKKGISRAKLMELEKAILMEKSGAIFIDDIHLFSPATIAKIKLFSERFTCFATGKAPYKESLTQILWSMFEINLRPIEHSKRLKLAEEMIRHLGSSVSPVDTAHASGGNPRKMLAYCKGNINMDSGRTKTGDELNLAPVVFLGMAAIIILRFIGRTLGQDDIYLISGIMMAGFSFARIYLSRGMK